MKTYRLLLISAVWLALSACNNWLDITPADSVTEEKLYETGQGYRNALNGVYKQIATEAVYGGEMSYGLVDVMGQVYASYRIPSSHKYYEVASEYKYTGKKIKDVIENLWSKTYNSIANCNNMIGRIVGEEAGKFAGGKMEQDMIHGEALALRAILHFDMLRLFAPAKIKDDQKKYIPYFETYPSRFEPNQSVEEILEKVIRDLDEAKNLVASFDTIPERLEWMSVRYRYEGETLNSSEFNVTELFYTYRGYRMNYFAICAMLARVYNYAGMYKEANDIAQTVIEAKGRSGNLFTFTPVGNVVEQGNRKLYNDLIFALSNSKMFEIYELANTSGNDFIFSLNNYYGMFDDPSDVRRSLTDKVGYLYYCNKYLKPSTGAAVKFTEDMIPMIRLSEMYYIQAEYEMSVANWTAAAQKLDKVREGRNCTIGNLDITDEESFLEQLFAEVNREFMSEGQVFFYYKKFGKSPGYNTLTDEQFYLPLPDNETIH